jgi:uncharacterized membrane protein
MDGNPYSTPAETDLAVQAAPPQSRIASAVVSAVVGVPASGVLAYLLFGWCAAIGSAVISDDTWFTYSPQMFVWGALCGVLPCIFCGLLNPDRPIISGIVSHALGAIAGAILASAHFRWPLVMGCYAGLALVLPGIIAATRRPAWFLR